MLWKTIREHMLEYPDRILKENDVCYTYREFIELADDFSKQLDGCLCCAVLCETGIFTGMAMLSCFAAGVTAVPLSYRYGEKHIRKIFDLIMPPYVICEKEGSLKLISTGNKGYEVPDTFAAVIMSTSGTTGNPKGVMLSEGNLLSNIEAVSGYFNVKSGSNILISRPLYHCAVLTGEFLLSLYKGINIYFCDGRFDPLLLADTISSEKIDIFCGTPTMLSLVMRVAERKNGLRTPCTIAVSGECLTYSLAEKLKKQLPYSDIYHVYGLTEASPRVSFLPPSMFGKKSCCVGYPVSATAVMISDDGLPVSNGTMGEVLVKGPGVMMGYYKNKPLTEKTLYGGWLHTGDEGYIDENGMLCICGRRDDMIIRAGMNIYPSEIENEIIKDPRIRSAIARGFKDKNGITRIALDVDGDICSVNEVSELCKRLLPEYMQPSIIDISGVSEIGDTGKIKRRREANE